MEEREAVKKIARRLETSQVLVQQGNLRWVLYDEKGRVIATDLEALDRVRGRWCVCRIRPDKAVCEVMEDEDSVEEVEVPLG